MYFQYGCTPLHDASAYGRLEVMQLLLDRGSDVHAKDNVSESISESDNECNADLRVASLAIVGSHSWIEYLYLVI